MATEIHVDAPPVRVMELSRLTGISAAHICKIFGGKRTPSFANAAKIATALNISLDELYVRLSIISERAAAEENADGEDTATAASA